MAAENRKMWQHMTQQKEEMKTHGDIISSRQRQTSDNCSTGSSSSSSSSIFTRNTVVEVSRQQLEEAGYAQAQQLLAPLVGKSPQELEGCLPQVLPRLAPLLADRTMDFLYLPAPKGTGVYAEVCVLMSIITLVCQVQQQVMVQLLPRSDNMPKALYTPWCAKVYALRPQGCRLLASLTARLHMLGHGNRPSVLGARQSMVEEAMKLATHLIVGLIAPASLPHALVMCR
jgi:hypothetical protein